MHNIIKFRNAKTTDAEKIAKIWAAGWLYAYGGILSAEFLSNRTNIVGIQKKSEKIIRHILGIDNDTDIFIVITHNDNIIGYVEGGVPESPECKADTELDELYIDTKYIGHGIGKILLQKFASEMKKRGAETFGLMCFSDNKSMNFYKHMGGHVTIERPSSEKFEHKMGSFIEFDIDDVLGK